MNVPAALPRIGADLTRDIASREAALAKIAQLRARLDADLAAAREHRGAMLASARLGTGEDGGAAASAARQNSKLIDDMERNRSDLAAEAAVHERELASLRDALEVAELQALRARQTEIATRWLAAAEHVDQTREAFFNAIEAENRVRGEMRDLAEIAGDSVTPFNAEISRLSLFGLAASTAHHIKAASSVVGAVLPGPWANILEFALDRRTYVEFLREALRRAKVID